uniref:Uncharacterized protein n=1 Tax=Aegilops tauschii TaxID=37682 RepID=M8BWB8_AEGTA
MREAPLRVAALSAGDIPVAVSRGISTLLSSATSSSIGIEKVTSRCLLSMRSRQNRSPPPYLSATSRPNFQIPPISASKVYSEEQLAACYCKWQEEYAFNAFTTGLVCFWSRLQL